jgi:predicted aminopeptidase
MRIKVITLVKRTLLVILVLIAGLVLVYRDLVGYGLKQAYGQLHIVWNAKPIDHFLNDPAFPDSLKAKLRFIEEVRRYAIDSLGLKDTKNYKTLFDQKGEEIMWVVTAAEPFRLHAKEWSFPVLGSVPYKGFFNKEEARSLRDQLEDEGWDVSMRNPGGWSTLGWFTDPILSKMLERSRGDLASLIIHEMSHATIFVKDSVDFNENLASFIGDRGAEMFLISKYGPKGEPYVNFIEEDRDYVKYVGHVLRGIKVLDSLYDTMNETDLLEEKLRLKQQTIQRIVQNMDTLDLATRRQPSQRFREKLPNNAYFMSFVHYQSQQDELMQEWREKFNGDLKAYIKYLNEKFPFL